MSLVEQIQALQYSEEPKEKMEELKAALDKYHKMVEEGVLVPRQNSLQNGYAGNIGLMNIKWSNV